MKKACDYFKKNPQLIFFIICISGIVSYIFASFLYGAEVMKWMVQENNPNIRFVDYFMHIRYASNPSGLYDMVADDTQGCFPPLAYVLYYFLNRLTCTRFGGQIPNREEFETITGTYLVYIYYTIFVAVLIFAGVSMLNKKKNAITGKNVLIFVCIMMSCPFMGSGFLVGNSAMLVFGLLLIFFALRNHESAVIREIAMIILAVCAGMKIYPAVFGLLYLKEKKWKEAVRLIIYGIVLFLLPFAFFGGVHGFVMWIGHIKGTMNLMLSYRIEYIKGVAYIVLPHLGIEVGTKLFGVLCSIAPMAFVVLMIGLAAFSKNEHRTLLFLTAIMAFYPTNAYRYSLSYIAIPLVIWLQSETADNKVEEYIKAIFYGMVFAIPVLWGIITGFRLNFDHVHLTYVEVWIYLMAYALLGIEIIIQVVEYIRNIRKNRVK